ncbi:MAG: hypothetical protein AAF725_00385 [Acidobacteriota bacterium]
MSVRDYRRQIEHEIAQARALASERARGQDPEEGELGIAAALPAEGASRLEESRRALLANREADPRARAAALAGLLTRSADPETAHLAALERVQDPQESAEIKKAGLQLLRQSAFASPTADAWRPAFLDAARSEVESDDAELRLLALEILCQEKDRFSQERLLAGLRDPARALVDPADALALLANDIHSEVQGIARQIADDPPSPRARVEALLLLSADPESVDRFAALFADPAEDSKVRQLAASALTTLDPKRFRAVAREVTEGEGLGIASASGDDGPSAIVRHAEALLRLDG